MTKSTFSPEVRERAVRMMREHCGDHAPQWACIESIAARSAARPQTLDNWVKQHERDGGQRDGPTSAEAQRIRELECENRELRKANEILKLASAFLPRRSSTAG